MDQSNRYFLAFDVLQNAERHLFAALFYANIEPADFNPAQLSMLIAEADGEVAKMALKAVKLAYDRVVSCKEELQRLGGRQWL